MTDLQHILGARDQTTSPSAEFHISPGLLLDTIIHSRDKENDLRHIEGSPIGQGSPEIGKKVGSCHSGSWEVPRWAATKLETPECQGHGSSPSLSLKTEDQGPSSRSWAESSTFLPSLLTLLRPSTDWTRPTHLTEGQLLDSKSTELHVNFIPNTLSGASRIAFDQIPRHHGPTKVTYKFSHHKLPREETDLG